MQLDDVPISTGKGTVKPTKAGGHRSQRFLDVLGEYESVLLITHDNPDPDAIASGWALHTLIGQKLGKPVRLLAGGAIVRAENRQLVLTLKPPIELVNRVDQPDHAAIVLVDCAPTAGNHLLEHVDIKPTAVIDHHTAHGPRYRVRFRDIRPKMAATATIASCYLKEQEVMPTPQLATALLYAIHSDALGWTPYTRPDQHMIAWLSQWVDYNALTDIESAPFSPDYYGDLLLAMESTITYGDVALCFLPHAHGAEIVGEVADLLVRCRDLTRVLCAAVVDGDVLVSVRTTQQGGDASDLVYKTLAGLGGGGGHANRAGGKIRLADQATQISEGLQGEIRKRWLAACDMDPPKGARLVARRDILENL